MTMRVAGYSLLALLVLVLAPQAGLAGELRIAAWNLEHLDDSDGEGCVGRKSADYAALARRIADLGAVVVAFQEVENAAAAHRVFPASDWHVEMSGRPPKVRSRACWDKREARLGHLATGFAIRRGLEYRLNGDLKALGGAAAFQRWGARTSRSWREAGSCASCRCISGPGAGAQSRTGKAAAGRPAQRFAVRWNWADARRAAGTAFVILGDFNRRLTLPGDWAWNLLSPPSASLRLMTEGVPFRCDPRFPAFIDHMVAGGGAEAMQVAGSFREAPQRGQHPDHCTISAVFRMGS